MKKNIYVVEDNDDIQEMIEYLLSAENYHVEGFPTATLFRNKMAQSYPDLILLDVMLPDGNGVQICKEIKTDESTHNIPILLMSAHTNLAYTRQECEAEDFISKPFDIQDLVRRVDKYAGINPA